MFFERRPIRTRFAILLCACTLATTGGCNIGASMVWSALYSDNVRLDESTQQVAPWIGPDTRAESWVVERFDLVRGTTHDTDDEFWKFPGDHSRVSYASLQHKIERFESSDDPGPPQADRDVLTTVVALRPMVALLTPRRVGESRFFYAMYVRTWATYDPDLRWFSPDLDVQPTSPIFESPDRAHIDVPWGRLVLTRQPDERETGEALQSGDARSLWVVTTEPAPSADLAACASRA